MEKRAVVDNNTPSILSGRRGDSVEYHGESISKEELNKDLETVGDVIKKASEHDFKVKKEENK